MKMLSRFLLKIIPIYNKNISIIALIQSNCRSIYCNYVSIYVKDYLNCFSFVRFSICIIINCNVMAKNKTYSVRAQIGQLVVILNTDDSYYSLVVVCNNSPISLCILRKFSPFSVVLNV